MGFLNLSLDWANVAGAYSLFLTPWWTQVVAFAAFAVNCWVLLPWAKWGNLGSFDYGLMSNRLFLENGTQYPINDVMTADTTLNETAYAELGPPYTGTQMLWSMFFGYACYTSALVWVALFGYGQLKAGLVKVWERRKAGSVKISEQFNDQLNIIQRAYPEVPFWWFFALFMCSFVSLITIFATGNLFIPVFTYFVAILTGALMVIPLGWLYALSNYQLVSCPGSCSWLPDPLYLVSVLLTFASMLSPSGLSTSYCTA
jgi:hypothetical protein